MRALGLSASCSSRHQPSPRTVNSDYSECGRSSPGTRSSRQAARRNPLYGERPNGYLVFTPENRMLALVTAEHRKKPETDEDRVAAFRSMAAYSGIYRVEGDRWITKVDIAWTESWTGTEQMRFFKLEGDTLTVSTPWLLNPNLPGNPETRGVLVWRRVKATR